MPKRLGHYEIVSELGRGGMGVVYKAYEPALDRHVAIKVLSDQMAEDPLVVARFQREARSVAALHHPNIIQIFFIGESEGRHYFVMEFVEGESLSAYIRRQTRVPVAKALEILIQICEGLSAAHDIGVVHRDIKPANIMLDRHARVKIADFGIALTADLQKKLTSTGQFLGTPGYLSPEVCLGEKADARTDIFSLGIVLYEMLSGEVPFHADSPLAMLSKVVNEAVPDVRQINQNVAPEVQAILSKMVEKNRENRYADCHELLEVLKDQLGKTETVKNTQKSMMTAPTEVIQVPGQPPPPPGRTEAVAAPPRTPQATEAISAPPVPPPPGTEPLAARPAPAVQRPMSEPAKKRGWLLPVFLLLLVPVLAGGGYLLWQQQKETEPKKVGSNEPVPAGADSLDDLSGDHGTTPTDQNPGDETEADGEVMGDPGQAEPPGNGSTRTDSGQGGTTVAGIEGNHNEDAESEPQTSNHHGSEVADPTQLEENDPGQTVQTHQDKPRGGLGGVPETGNGNSRHGDDLRRNGHSAVADSTVDRPIENPEGNREEPVAVIGKTQMVVLVHGDAWVAEPIAQELQGQLEGSGYDLQDGSLFEGLDTSPESKLNLPAMMKSVSAQGGHILVVGQVTFLSERTLNYMGRQSQAYKSRLKVSAINLITRKKIVQDWMTEFEYTQLNATSKVESAMHDLPDAWSAAVRNAARSL